MTIHILTLNWNGEEFIDKMLFSLIQNLKYTNLKYKIHIRDNGSKDNSLKIIEKYPVNIYEMNHNRNSFSEGMNYLYEQAKPIKNDLVLLLNNDIEFKDTKSLTNMITTQKKYNASVVGAKLLYNNGKISHNGIIFSKKYGNMPWHFREGEIPNKHDLLNRKFQAVTAACAIITPQAFETAGKFNTNLRWAFEDVDLNLEISLNQKKTIICCGNTNIIHLTSASLDKTNTNRLFLQQNVQFFKNKWFGKYKIDHDLYLNNNKYNII